MKNKNAAGIEIIPLGDKLPPDDQKHRSPSKDIKRSLSEDDKRRLEKKKHCLLYPRDSIKDVVMY